MKETITIDKKVLFDLLSFVEMTAEELATGVTFQDNPTIPEQYSFAQWDQLPQDLAKHVELITHNVRWEFLHQCPMLKLAKSIMCHVAQACHADDRANLDIALQCVTKALAALPSLEKQLMKFANDLNDAMAEAEENKIDLGY